MSDKSKEETFGSKEKPQEELILMPRAWRLYVGRETCQDVSGVGMILDSPGRKVKGMKGLHVFVGSKLLVDQVEGSRIPRTKEAKKYREEIMDATAPFHRQIQNFCETSGERSKEPFSWMSNSDEQLHRRGNKYQWITQRKKE
ncbi:hypothetical protein Tco_0760567 [Tanacetum coccineum]